MEKLFVPYSANCPAAVEIKGHRLLIVATDAEEMVQALQFIGGDEIREMNFDPTGPDQSQALAELAAKTNCGVVLTPPGMPLALMVQSLEKELPWVH